MSKDTLNLLFERHVAAEYGCNDFRRDGPGYMNHEIDVAWELWKAASRCEIWLNETQKADRFEAYESWSGKENIHTLDGEKGFIAGWNASIANAPKREVECAQCHAVFEVGPKDIVCKDCAQPVREISAWQPPETAPKGEIGGGSTDGGLAWRGNSEWFLGHLKDGTVCKIQRLPENYGHEWKDKDETYYAKDWLVGWQPLPDNDIEVQEGK